MRPPIHDTARPASRWAQRATMAAAVLAVLLSGTVEARAGDTGRAAQASGTSRMTGGTGLGGAARQVPAAAVAAKKKRLRGVTIDLNLSTQRATYYKNGKKVATFNISSGKRGWRTPTGTYRVQRKLYGWRRSPLGLMWKPAYFRGGYAIHGSRSVPRHPASHGCVRVTMSRMNWLSPRLPIGSTVRVHY